MQRAVEERWNTLDDPIGAALGETGDAIDWLSPLRHDDFAEYRDDAFLARLDLGQLKPALAAFWPRRGPQWDAIGRSRSGQVVLVEAKAHVGEFLTPGSAAGGLSREWIATRLGETATALGSRCGDRWSDQFYQYANRLAHLRFLREAGIQAWLVLVGFLDDREMKGPSCAETWQAVYRIADHILGLPSRHPMSRFIDHVFPSVMEHG